MRVIAGKVKGKLLIAPEGMDTRPIMAKMKEALFSMWQFRIIDKSFLDLFAGSGSMGIEALSRGASKAYFVEKSKKAIDVINTNIKNCGLQKDAIVYHDDVFDRVNQFKANNQKFDIIYMDPPFTVDEIFDPVLKCVAQAQILAEDGILAIRTKKERELDDHVENLVKYKKKTYGKSTIHFYTYEEEENE